VLALYRDLLRHPTADAILALLHLKQAEPKARAGAGEIAQYLGPASPPTPQVLDAMKWAEEWDLRAGSTLPN